MKKVIIHSMDMSIYP